MYPMWYKVAFSKCLALCDTKLHWSWLLWVNVYLNVIQGYDDLDCFGWMLNSMWYRVVMILIALGECLPQCDTRLGGSWMLMCSICIRVGIISIDLWVFFQSMLPLVDTGAVFKLRFLTFDNGGERDFYGSCCDTWCIGSCDPLFIICLDDDSG